MSPLAAIVNQMNTGEWAQIPNSSINSVLLTKPEADAIDPRIWGVTGSTSVISVWSSSAYDQAGHRWFFGVAGGHAAYNGNELYTYDLETLSWSRMYDPSPMTSNMSHGDPIPAWGPQATHHYDGLIYMANGNGIASVVDPATGERLWQERIGGVYTATPVAGDGKVYLFSETGEAVVLEAGAAPRVLSRNPLNERVIASPAIAGGRIFVRTDRHLVAIGR